MADELRRGYAKDRALAIDGVDTLLVGEDLESGEVEGGEGGEGGEGAVGVLSRGDAAQ